jgi:cytochrome c
MYRSEMRKITAKTIAAATGLVLGLSYANAGKYTPADPNHYPFHDPKVRQGKAKVNIDGAVIRPAVNGDMVNHSPIKVKKGQFALGTKATKEQIDAWNVDVRPDGKGLPPGKMTVEDGAEVFANNCAMCHGDFGEGAGKNPVLVGGKGTLRNQAKTGGEESPEKTLGSYAPYIAPFFWYIKMAMPLPTPKKLSNDQVYGIIGYLLQLNEIQVNGKEIEDDTVIDANFLKNVHLPNEKGFEYNDLRHPYSHGKRCMKDCIDTKKIKVMHIAIDATDSIKPPVKVPRYNMGAPKYDIGLNGYPAAEAKLPAQKGSADNGAEAAYKASCAACHDSGAAGAPVTGNKGDWSGRIKEGSDTLYTHAIKGFNGMPPKGGNMSLGDDRVKQIVDFMVGKSK